MKCSRNSFIFDQMYVFWSKTMHFSNIFPPCFGWDILSMHHFQLFSASNVVFVELSTNSMFLLISASNTFFRQFKQTNSFSVNLRETCQKKVKTLKKKVKSRKIGNWRTKKSVFKEAVKDKKNVIKKLLEEQKSVIKKSDRQKKQTKKR